MCGDDGGVGLAVSGFGHFEIEPVFFVGGIGFANVAAGIDDLVTEDDRVDTIGIGDFGANGDGVGGAWGEGEVLDLADVGRWGRGRAGI